MPELSIINEKSIVIDEETCLSKTECRRKTWRDSSRKYYQQNKERIIKRNLENYHKKKLDKTI